MPSLTFGITPAGPVLTLGIHISGAMRSVMDKALWPEIQVVTALLDTGASGTLIDHSIATALGLQVRSQTKMITPSSGPAGIQVPVYDVSVWILSDDPPNQVLERSVPVIGTALSHQGFDVLLGRDILSDCTVFYNGQAKSCTLSF